ncbi:MAG: ABC transporter substrate-binding protein [Erysipelotrichaceae bacterium]|nr:ABC transporter substrate-binding protein [Erysipelotrichaceae bacterium]
MKRLFKLLLAAIMVLGVAACSSDEPATGDEGNNDQPVEQYVVDTTSFDDLVAKAQEEGGPIRIYSTHSSVEKGAALFTEKYGIEVEFTQIGDAEMIEKVANEVRAGVEGGVDLIFVQDGARLKNELIDTGYVVNYVNERIASWLPEEDLFPLVFQYCSKVFIYNSENQDGTRWENIWAVTDPANYGLFQMKDTGAEGVNANFFTMLLKEENIQKLEAAYKEYYGTDLVLTEENAAYEWIKLAYQNGLILGTSDTKICEAVGAAGQNQDFIGLFTLNKYAKKDEKGLILEIADDMNPIAGFFYPIYGLVSAKAEHPYGAQALLEYLYTPEGWEPWTTRVGDYSANTENAPAEGDKTIAEWSNVLVREDAAFVAEHRAEMEDFISSIAQ